MTLEQVQNKVSAALRDLQRQDSFLLVNDLHERSIAHQFAVYLQRYFRSYRVDCEYNGNLQSESGRKVIYSLNSELNNIRATTQIALDNPMEEEMEALKVFPDIIVHHRGHNTKNLLVIEIKKSSNRRYHQFDKEKLCAFTAVGCEFQYNFGLFLEIGTGNRTEENFTSWYANGAAI